MTLIRYLTHPQVRIDPAVPVTDWSLSPQGAARVAALAGSGALAGTRRVIASAEVKAQETAAPLAAALGCAVETRPAMHENDRSATGFLPPAEFEKVADAFFATPETSVRGWETARAAQARIVAEVQTCLAVHQGGDVLFVGHGAVGTLLWCALAGQPISRRHDQLPGGGCCFAFTPGCAPQTGWAPMEQLWQAPPQAGATLPPPPPLA